MEALRALATNDIERLNVGDLANFWAESATTPMHIALVGVLSPGSLVDATGAFDLAAARERVAERLFRAPKLLRRVRWTRLGEGAPLWDADASFDIARHVDVADTPPMSEAELLQWCANDVLRPFDRMRPLWRLRFIPRIDGQNVGVLVVIHHAVADGLRGVALIGSLLDDSAGAVLATSPSPERPPSMPRPVRSSELLLRNARELAARMWSFVLHAPGIFGRIRRRWRSAVIALDEMRGRVPHTPLTVEIGPTRRVLMSRCSLEEARDAAHAKGVTINDVVLAAVTGGLREWMLSLKASVAVPLRASVPIGATASNAGGVMLVPLPIHEEDASARLAAISSFTRAAKAKHAAFDGETAWTFAWAPRWLSRLWVKALRSFGSTRVNAYVTNVPGPATPLYLGDARLISATPLGPLVAGVALSVAVFSYAGTLSVVLQLDGSIPAADVLGQRMDEALREEIATAGSSSRAPSRDEGSGARESGARESGARESGARESGASESGASESGASESGTSESGTSESGTSESGTSESGTASLDANMPLSSW